VLALTHLTHAAEAEAGQRADHRLPCGSRISALGITFTTTRAMRSA